MFHQMPGQNLGAKSATSFVLERGHQDPHGASCLRYPIQIFIEHLPRPPTSNTCAPVLRPNAPVLQKLRPVGTKSFSFRGCQDLVTRVMKTQDRRREWLWDGRGGGKVLLSSAIKAIWTIGQVPLVPWWVKRNWKHCLFLKSQKSKQVGQRGYSGWGASLYVLDLGLILRKARSDLYTQSWE